MKLSPAFTVVAASILAISLSASAAAQTITGTVKNGTTGKPSVGDEVVLIKLAQGMEEAGRTKADSKGAFSFKLDDAKAPHLIRAIHQDVTYHRMAPPGTTSVEVEVYDAAKKVEGISVTADVMRCQVEQGQLEVMRLFVVNNSSSPAKTQMNDHNFEFYLPDGAKIVESSATAPNGNPLKSAPVPQSEKNRYAFLFPLRPGETRFSVAYQAPYSGSATIDPRPLYAMQHFVIMIPKAMQFTAGPNAQFQSMNDPKQADTTIQVATMTQPNQPLSFKLSGEGVLPQMSSSSGGGGGAEGSGPSSDARPGGGLGPPIDAPDPLQKYRWYIIGGFVLVLAAGGYYIATRQQPAAVTGGGANSPAVDLDIPDLPPRVPTVRRAPSSTGTVAVPAGSSMLMEGLKEELFQLEVEHKQGRISQQEYDKAKAALDATLERAIKRQAQKV